MSCQRRLLSLRHSFMNVEVRLKVENITVHGHHHILAISRTATGRLVYSTIHIHTGIPLTDTASSHIDPIARHYSLLYWRLSAVTIRTAPTVKLQTVEYKLKHNAVPSPVAARACPACVNPCAAERCAGWRGLTGTAPRCSTVQLCTRHRPARTLQRNTRHRTRAV